MEVRRKGEGRHVSDTCWVSIFQALPVGCLAGVGESQNSTSSVYVCLVETQGSERLGCAPNRKSGAVMNLRRSPRD